MHTTSARHSVSVAAIIVNDEGQVLLTQRADNGRWEPPGGILELDETIEDGLRREVAEETGLAIDIDTLTGVYKNMPRSIIALIFRCHPASGPVRPSAETRAFFWADRGQITDHMDPAYAARAIDALDYDGRPAIRTHDGRTLVG